MKGNGLRQITLISIVPFAVFSCNPEAPSDNRDIIIPFTAKIAAADLTVDKITAHTEGEQIVFNVHYDTGLDRALSLFNPPRGDRLNYYDEDALSAGRGSVSFEIPGSTFGEIFSATLKLFNPADPDKDANFLHLEIFDKPIMDSLGIELGKLPKRSPPAKTFTSVSKFQDVRFGSLSNLADSLPEEIVPTLTFNLDTRFGELKEMTQAVIEKGKNPGLGVRALHSQGITGKGVNIAIIDQNLCLNHPEFAGKIAAYHDVGCEQHPGSGSMHAPAVTSLLVGETIGTAPAARIYFAAAPSWTADAKYQADALEWIIETTRSLPEGSKIRAVSVSAAPSGEGSPFLKNNGLWDASVRKAKRAGILVLDCTSGHGFIGPCFYDRDDPEDPAKCQPGFPRRPGLSPRFKEHVLVPNSFRTVAEEYTDGYPAYAYWGQGGLSLAIPYATGVLALGWQLRPDLEPDEIVKLLRDTAYLTPDGYRIINPAAFVAAVENLK